MKLTDDNIIKQQALDKKLGVEKNTKLGRSAQAKPKASVGMLNVKELLYFCVAYDVILEHTLIYLSS